MPSHRQMEESTALPEHVTDAGVTSPLRVLALDGGGAKGFYTLGVVKEIEGMIQSPLYKRFDLVFGTSTGAIIACLIALGYNIDDIHELYKRHVPTVMAERSASGRTAALSQLAKQVFGEKLFSDVKTGVGVVATKWTIERPMIFKVRSTKRMVARARSYQVSASLSLTQCRRPALRIRSSSGKSLPLQWETK